MDAAREEMLGEAARFVPRVFDVRLPLAAREFRDVGQAFSELSFRIFLP